WNWAEIEEHLLRNSVLSCKPTAGPKILGLWLLSRPDRIRSDNVVVAAEIVKSAVLVTENLKCQWRLTDILVICLNSRSRLARLDLDEVGNGPARTLFWFLAVGRCATG